MQLYAKAFGIFCFFVGLSFNAQAAEADGSVRGSLLGFEALQPAQYVSSAKADSKRWAWREPSPAVAVQFLAPSALPSRDISVVAEAVSTPSAAAPMLVRVTGGRMIPSTLVVAPGAHVQFKNVDPFPHRLKGSDAAQFPQGDLAEGAVREWIAGPPGSWELSDESSPGLRGYVVVSPQAARYTLPKSDGHFQLLAPEGDYVLKVYFAGKAVGASETVHLSAGRVSELKSPIKLSVGGAL